MATCKATDSSEGADAENGSELFCSPCHNDGEQQAAVGYCKNCKEYLCAECFKYHKRLTLTMKHDLLTEEHMTRDVSILGDMNKCPNHNDRSIDYHCKTHSFFGCHDCSCQHQTTCKDVISIPEVSEAFSSSEEMKYYVSKLESIAKTSNDILSEARSNIDSTEKCTSEAISAIKGFKVKIMDTFDRLEHDLIKKTDAFKAQEISKMNDIVKRCIAIQEAQQVAATEMDVLKNNNKHNDLYIAVVTGTEKLLSLDNELTFIESDKDVNYLKFVNDTKLMETVKGPLELGALLIQDDIEKVDFVADINVKTSKDTYDSCIVYSALMPNNQLVLVDINNSKVKLVNTRQHKMVSDMKLSNSPRGVSKVTNNTIAVAVPDAQKVVFVKLEPSLRVEREFEVNGPCYGIAYHDGKLIVTFNSNPPKLEIMDLQGTVLRSMHTDSSGRQMFNSPYYVTLNTKHDLMYVSNYSGDNIVCLSFSGSVVATYKDTELEKPCQAVVDSTGMIYVCARESNNLHQLTPDCRKVKVPLTASDRLSSPGSISYDKTGGKLYIGEWGKNNVKVYTVNFSKL